MVPVQLPPPDAMFSCDQVFPGPKLPSTATRAGAVPAAAVAADAGTVNR